ncbi:MAG TPA: response regulator transcription factor [Anaerolineaceae bacterium]|nr:response regulator transcription factor [Anaerolineaceae bacterium]
MAETILVVEDEQNIQEIVCLYLKRAGYLVIPVSDGQQALEVLARQSPDLIVLDIMLPFVDGYEITRRVRQAGEIPIIILTARREESDRISGLEMGADDYVVKPFSPQELVSRVRAVLRRTRPAAEEKRLAAPLTFTELVINPQTRIVQVDNREIELTSKEFDLLWLLAQSPRQVFSRDQLLDKIWGISDYIDPSTVTVHMRRLREKIEKDPSRPTHIITVWGVGYRFEP